MPKADNNTFREKTFLPNGLFRKPSEGMPIEKGMLPFIVEKLNLPWEDALEYGKRVEFRQGEILSSLKEQGNYFYYLKKGSVQTWYEDELGLPLFHLFMRSGMLINEMICLSDIHMNDFMIFMEESVAYRFDKTKIFTEDFCKKYSYLLLNAACSIARKGLILSEFRNAFANMETLNHVARILYAIAASGDRIEITQDNMAKILRVHRSSIVRVLRKLRNMKILEKSTKKELVILDMEALKKLAMGCNR